MKPIDLVEKQLAGYNARDVETFASVYSDDVRVHTLADGKTILEGIENFKKHYAGLFEKSPNLNGQIKSRMVVGDFVIDHERVSGRLGETIEAVAIYKISGGKISEVWFAK